MIFGKDDALKHLGKVGLTGVLEGDDGEVLLEFGELVLEVCNDITGTVYLEVLRKEVGTVYKHL